MKDQQTAATRYKSKPSTIQAMQWTGDNAEAIRSWIDRPGHQRGFSATYMTPQADLFVVKAHRWVPVQTGDYVIAEPDGDGYYPCQQAIFEDRWEPVDNGSAGGAS